MTNPLTGRPSYSARLSLLLALKLVLSFALVFGLSLSARLAEAADRIADQITEQQAPTLPVFSGMTPGTAIPGWQTLKPASGVDDTRYSIVTDQGVSVLKAEANNSMSGLTHAVRVDIREFPLLRWRWKIASPVQGADMTRKTGDDYAARLYVMFDYPTNKLPFGTRAKIKLAETLYGQKIPTAALNYVWDNRQPIGTIQANTYTDRARMIVLQSGSANTGQWVTETRDLGADFRAAFGEDAPDVVAIAVATDTDNTGESALAWYGDIAFLPRTPEP